jgi:DNA-binding HxlR family transcriptional regulator
VQVKDYGQFCGVSRAADILGQRWAILIVRDLLVAPTRYGDLLTALPGIPTNMLSTRLKELEAAGVVERRTVPGQRGVVYQLTDWGRRLEPAIDALGRWGAATMDTPRQGEVVTDAIVASMLRTAFRGRTEDAPATPTVFQIVGSSANGSAGGSIAAHAVVTGDHITVATGRHPEPDLEIAAGPTLRAFVAGEITPADFAADPSTVVTGTSEQLARFSRLFRIPLLQGSGG